MKILHRNIIKNNYLVSIRLQRKISFLRLLHFLSDLKSTIRTLQSKDLEIYFRNYVSSWLSTHYSAFPFSGQFDLEPKPKVFNPAQKSICTFPYYFFLVIKWIQNL